MSGLMTDFSFSALACSRTLVRVLNRNFLSILHYFLTLLLFKISTIYKKDLSWKTELNQTTRWLNQWCIREKLATLIIVDNNSYKIYWMVVRHKAPHWDRLYSTDRPGLPWETDIGHEKERKKRLLVTGIFMVSNTTTTALESHVNISTMITFH